MTKRILILDSLRGIASLIVVFHHFFVYNSVSFEALCVKSDFLYDLATFISDQNQLAVIFFFALSGFVIYLATHKLDFARKADLNHYFYRRFRRILPLYWFAIVFTLIVGMAAGIQEDESFSSWNLIGNLLFLQTSDNVGSYWFEPYGQNGPLWSLAYEMFFYAFFPFLLLLLNKVPNKLWGGISLPARLVLVSFALGLLAICVRLFIFIPYLSFLSLFPIWTSGYYLGFLYREGIYADRFVIGLSTMILGFWGVNQYIQSATLFILVEAWSFIIIPGYSLYRFKLLDYLQPLRHALNSIFLKLGEGSYAIYLLHYSLVLYMAVYLGLDWWVQAVFLITWCFVSVYLENWLNSHSYSFLKRSYV